MMEGGECIENGFSFSVFYWYGPNLIGIVVVTNENVLIPSGRSLRELSSEIKVACRDVIFLEDGINDVICF